MLSSAPYCSYIATIAASKWPSHSSSPSICQSVGLGNVEEFRNLRNRSGCTTRWHNLEQQTFHIKWEPQVHAAEATVGDPRKRGPNRRLQYSTPYPFVTDSRGIPPPPTLMFDFEVHYVVSINSHAHANHLQAARLHASPDWIIWSPSATPRLIVIAIGHHGTRDDGDKSFNPADQPARLLVVILH
jgi:hypothetical protein